MPRSLKYAPSRNQSSSSALLICRSPVNARFTSAGSPNASASARCCGTPSGPAQATLPGPAPRRRSSPTAAAMVDGCQPTSAVVASRRASGRWLWCWTNSASGWPGVTITAASAVTGQPVSHCTPEPDRLAP
jgi:hypothetical protein